MKEVELYGGCDIDRALEIIKAEAESVNEECFSKFNGECIYSTDTIDEAYQRVLGKTKAEHDAEVQKWLEERKRREEEHKANMPNICEQYRREARGLVLDEALEEWDSIMEVRVGDLYHGMEMRNVLDCCRAMRDESLTREQRLRKAFKIFMDAGHSGMSAGLTRALLRRFCPDGVELANACDEFRYEKDHKTRVYVARNPDGKLFMHFTYPHWMDDGSFVTGSQVELNPLMFPEIEKGFRVEYNVGDVFNPRR